MDNCANDPSKSSTEKKNEHEMCGYSLFTDCSFDKKNNKLDYYRGKDSLKRFCQDLKKQARSITDFEKKELLVLTIHEEFKHHTGTECYICEKKFYKDKKYNYIKARDHCHYTGKYRGAAHKIFNLMYNISREIPVVFNNGSSYDYHFIIKGLAEEFDGDFECLGENKEKYITFSVPIKKESNEDDTIIYRIKFIDSFRFISTSLSTLVDNLSNKIIENEKWASCKSYLEFIKIRNNGRLILECFDCKRRYKKDIDDETLKKIKTLETLIIFVIKTLISLCFY